MSRLILLACITFFSVATIGETAQMRNWQDRTGKFNVEAEFVRLNDDKTVTLKRKNGKEFNVPLDRLSSSDIDFVKSESKPRNESSALKEPAKTQRNVKGPADEDSRQAAPELNKREDKAADTLPQRPNVVNRIRSIVLQRESQSNLRRLATALTSYQSQKNRLPPPHTVLRNGEPGLSWRVALLPFLDEGNLQRLFKLNEPWDSPHNKALIEKMPRVFMSGGSEERHYGYTQFLAVVGDGMAFDTRYKKGLKLAQFADGTSKTAAIVEVDPSYGVIWTKPDDYFVPLDNPLVGLGRTWPNGFLAGFIDGSVKPISTEDGADAVLPIFTRAAGDAYSY